MRLLRILAAFGALLASLCWVGPASAANSGYGKLTGVVLNLAGTPQMGATIWLSPEADSRPASRLLTNQNGVFDSSRLRPGFYSVRATLAGFLPTVEQHIHVNADLTTLVRIQLDSVFASLDQLRRQPAQPSETDDWKWVLRTSAASRPVLQLLDGTVVVANRDSPDLDSPRQPRARVEMTNGSILPGSPSALSGHLGTAVSYDQELGSAGRLLVAGQMGIDSGSLAGDSLSGGLATIWLPGGELGRGSQTSVILRQVQPNTDGRIIRAMRVEHSEQLVFSDRLIFSYGAELVMGGSTSMTSTVRPRAQLAWRLSPVWSVALSLQTDPQSITPVSSSEPLESAINALSTAPVLLWRDGHISSLEGAWHEEFAVRREVGPRSNFQVAAFHDFSGHLAVFGFDPAGPQGQSIYAYGHDAGSGGSWGTRLSYTERISNNLEIAAIYAYAGALAPGGNASAAGSDISSILSMRYRDSLAGRISGKLPKGGTRFSASYKWLSGPVVGRQDLFGEAAEGVDPYLSLTLRQPLPSFHTGGHWEALADFRNVLSQGYVSVRSEEGQFVLMPVERSFQGGVSFQF